MRAELMRLGELRREAGGAHSTPKDLRIEIAAACLKARQMSWPLTANEIAGCLDVSRQAVYSFIALAKPKQTLA